MSEVESWTHAGLTVEVYHEPYIEEFMNPRTDGDYQMAHLAINYSGYELGDEQLPDSGLPVIYCPVCNGGDLEIHGPPLLVTSSIYGEREDEPVCHRCEGYNEVEPTIEEFLRERGAAVAAPLFIYEHSGMTIRAGSFKLVGEEITRDDIRSRGRFIGDDAGWDTSFVGFVYVTRQRALELGNDPNDTDLMIEGAKEEVKAYASYLEGDVVGYQIKDDDDNVLGGCGGFLGYWDNKAYIEEQANAEAESCARAIEKEKREVAEWAARDVMTVG